MSLDQRWMHRRYENGNLTIEFILGIFIHFASSQPTHRVEQI